MQTASDSKAFTEEEDGVFGGINQLTKSLHDLDERGLVLSLSAFSEDALGSLLKAFLLPSEATSQLLEGFNAPLGTLSARIKACYAIGLINKDQFHDLERLRKIRNEFAHTWRLIDLTQPKIAAQIKGMSYSRIDDRFPETPKKKIQSSMSCLLVELRSATHQIQKRGTQARVTGNHLMRGFAGNSQAQLQEARKELRDIQQKLESSEEDKREFYSGWLKLFSDRLSVLARPETAEQGRELLALREEVQHALLQHATRASL